MNVGDLFDPSGYDVMATIAHTEESMEILVMHNNSTHFLVGTRNIPYENCMVKLTNTFRYDDPRAVTSDDGVGFYTETYAVALMAAVGLAIRRVV